MAGPTRGRIPFVDSRILLRSLTKFGIGISKRKPCIDAFVPELEAIGFDPRVVRGLQTTVTKPVVGVGYEAKTGIDVYRNQLSISSAHYHRGSEFNVTALRVRTKEGGLKTLIVKEKSGGAYPKKTARELTKRVSAINKLKKLFNLPGVRQQLIKELSPQLGVAVTSINVPTHVAAGNIVLHEFLEGDHPSIEEGLVTTINSVLAELRNNATYKTRFPRYRLKLDQLITTDK